MSKTLAEQMEELDRAVADLGRALVESAPGQMFVRFHRWESVRIGETWANLATWSLAVVLIEWPLLLIGAGLKIITGK